jgi:hypothetical protein
LVPNEDSTYIPTGISGVSCMLKIDAGFLLLQDFHHPVFHCMDFEIQPG